MKRTDSFITAPIHTSNKLPMLKYVPCVLSWFYSATLLLPTWRQRSWTHLQTSNSLWRQQQPRTARQTYSCVNLWGKTSTWRTAQQERRRRREGNRPTIESMWSLQAQWKRYVRVLTFKSPHSGHSLCTTLKQLFS